MIYEVKMKEAMNEVFVDLMRKAEIDNKLTGRVKLKNEDLLPESETDGEVQLMSNPGGPPSAPRPAGAATPRSTLPLPAAASPEVIQQTQKLARPPVRK
jgi:hypothetical protein